MDIKSTILIYLHKEGKVAEYKMAGIVSGFEIWAIQVKAPGFYEELTIGPGYLSDDWFSNRDEALQAAMDYHETEGCALYLGLYPAPEKGGWKWIAQDYDGEWVGFNTKPNAGHVMWVVDPEPVVAMHNHISQSPPNPFWRKTLR